MTTPFDQALARSLMALRLEVPKEVADHHEKIVKDALAQAERANERARRAHLDAEAELAEARQEADTLREALRRIEGMADDGYEQAVRMREVARSALAGGTEP